MKKNERKNLKIIESLSDIYEAEPSTLPKLEKVALEHHQPDSVEVLLKFFVEHQ